VTDFVTASEARAAGKKTSAAETAEAKKKASASGGGKKTDDTSSPSTTCAKKRGRPFGSKNSGDKAQQPPVAHTTTEKKRDSGSFQVKTPSVHGPDPKTADGNRNAFVSPPSTGKSAGDVNHGAGTGKAAREKMANAWDNDASSELDVRSGKPTKKVRWDVDGIDLRGETGEANRHGEGHRHGDTDSTYREPTSRAFTVTTTTTTTTATTSVSIWNGIGRPITTSRIFFSHFDACRGGKIGTRSWTSRAFGVRVHNTTNPFSLVSRTAAKMRTGYVTIRGQGSSIDVFIFRTRNGRFVFAEQRRSS
jgi:hypothetical protein